MSRLFDSEPPFPDRPWKGRGYGRIRLDEALAQDLYGILQDEVGKRLNAYHSIKETVDERDRPSPEKLALQRAAKLRERVGNLIQEQGWQDRYELKEVTREMGIDDRDQ